MDQSAKVRIVHLNPGVISGTYVQNFQRLIPAEVNVTFEELGLLRGSRYEVGGKADEVITRALEFTRRYDPHGLIIAGAPLGIFNPGMEAKVAQAAGIPVVMAVPSVVAALKALSVKKLVVMTPWDEEMNAMLRNRLLDDDLAVLSCPLFEDPTPGAGAKVGPDEIFRRVERAFMEAGEAEAIYFQGAPLDPLPIIQRLEDRLGVPVIASNPATLWYVLSLLGHKFSIQGYGTLLRQWPKPLS